jgi:hypothetical protein
MNDIPGPKMGAVNFANGALTELAKRGGAQWAQSAKTGGMANKAGHSLVNQAAKLAPGAIAVAASTIAAAPAVAVAAGAVGAGIGIVCVGVWIKENHKKWF